MEQLDSRVDDYIAKSADFAQPILNHLRQLIHKAHPGMQETMKWGFPFFDHKGSVCHMSAFKQHCSLGFWNSRKISDPFKLMNQSDEPSAGNFGRITSIADLPDEEILTFYIREAVQLNEQKAKAKPAPKEKSTAVAKPAGELIFPNDFIMLLDGQPLAKTNFAGFSPSKQKEYVEWFADAKTEATRIKRMQTALEWIAQGKSRHWKYQS